MSLDILKKKLKEKDTAGLYYLCGAEEYLKSYYYEEMKKKTVTEMREFNITEPDGKDLSLNTLENAVNSFPMFSERKFVGIVDLAHDLLKKEEYKTELLRIISDLPDYVCLVFLDTAVKEGTDASLKKIVEKAKGTVVSVDRPTQGALAAWGKRHFQKLGKNISNENMQYILMTAENDMITLKNEIMKIASFSAGETVTRQEIDAVITRSLETNRFALSDALSKRDFNSAVRVIKDLYAQNYDDIQIVNLIYRVIVDLLRASWAMSGVKTNNDIARDFGMNPYGAAKMMRYARGLTQKQLVDCLDACLSSEVAIKQDGGDKREIVYGLIGKLISCRSGV